jgi:hypothetical protein
MRYEKEALGVFKGHKGKQTNRSEAYSKLLTSLIASRPPLMCLRP